MLTIYEIKRVFEREFWPIAGKFDTIVLKGDKVWASDDFRVARPGVYVWFKKGSVIKVGRNLTNARKRALEHVQDNTGSTMADLREDEAVQLILFTVHPDDYHWVASAEIYLENNLSPTIKSKRQG